VVSVGKLQRWLDSGGMSQNAQVLKGPAARDALTRFPTYAHTHPVREPRFELKTTAELLLNHSPSGW
jgi:hypothetical protein